MRVFQGISTVGGALRGASVALGNFDGVHLGHQALFATARVHAERRGAQTAALTFDPHPAKVLAPEVAPRQISPLRIKLALMERLALDAAIVQPFNLAFAQLAPEAFLGLLLDDLEVGELVVGFDFTYGKARGGTVDTLRAGCEARGVALSIVPKVTVDGLPASSTKIRELLLEGRVAPAARLLDRRYALEGVVVHGAGRGKGLGFPTANLASDFELTPGAGIYAALTSFEGRTWPTAVNIGRKPTFAGGTEPSTTELHLIGFEGDLYGKQLEACFLERLRPEQRFNGLEALKAQIALDVERSKEICAAARPLPLDPAF